MAYTIGTLTESSLNANDCHEQLIGVLRHLLGGFGDVGAITGTRTGDGTLSGFEAAPDAVTETWTITCTAVAVNSGTFSVTGSVSGAQAAATVGVAYDNGLVSFTITDGAADYQIGDDFVVPVTQGQLSADGRAWEVMRSTPTELIVKGPGLAGSDEIYIGYQAFFNSSSDVYNICQCVATGYTPGNDFINQPGAKYTTIPAHNKAITYYISANGQKCSFMLKIATSIYTNGYAGKGLMYARPSEWGYPVINGGHFDGKTYNRYSDLANNFPYHGEAYDGIDSSVVSLFLRDAGGNWVQPSVWPYSHGETHYGSVYNYPYIIASTNAYGCIVPINGNYSIEPLIMHSHSSLNTGDLNVWGEFDGVFFVSGYSNAVENVMQLGGSTVDQSGLTPAEAIEAVKSAGGRAFIVCQNVSRTEWNDFVAMEM